MTELSAEALGRLLVQQVPAIARRAVTVPTVGLGTVVAFDGAGAADVVLDGDVAPSNIQTLVGVFPNQRVAVLFHPPHGAKVIGVLAAIPGEPVFSTSYEVASSTVSSVGATSWVAEAGDNVGGWIDFAGGLVCGTAGWWDTSLTGVFDSDGGGTHRAVGLRSTGAAPDLNASDQFTAPGGAPTTGYGLALGASTLLPFAEGDALTIVARQDSGGPLDVSARVHLRWAGPLA